MNPFTGGTVALYGLWGNRGTVHSTMDTIRSFAKTAGYTAEPVVDELPDRRTDDGSTIVRHRWFEPGRPEVALYAVMGGGHTVPHPVMRFPRALNLLAKAVRTAATVNRGWNP